MKEEQIKELIRELQTSYGSGGSTNGWLISGEKNKELAELIVLRHFSKSKNEILELKTKLSIYEQIISKSNFAPIIEKKGSFLQSTDGLDAIA